MICPQSVSIFYMSVMQILQIVVSTVTLIIDGIYI